MSKLEPWSYVYWYLNAIEDLDTVWILFITEYSFLQNAVTFAKTVF